MGQYFKIVNHVKRQYIDPNTFAENNKASGVLQHGYHVLAVALLVCKIEEVSQLYGPLAGSWYGDPIIAAGDDYGAPDVYGIKTSTEEDPNRNLNQMAKDEFKDISYKAIAMLCEGRVGFAEVIVKKSTEGYSSELLIRLGNVVFQIGCKPLEEALEKVYGAEWTRKYKKAREENPW